MDTLFYVLLSVAGTLIIVNFSCAYLLIPLPGVNPKLKEEIHDGEVVGVTKINPWIYEVVLKEPHLYTKNFMLENALHPQKFPTTGYRVFARKPRPKVGDFIRCEFVVRQQGRDKINWIENWNVQR